MMRVNHMACSGFFTQREWSGRGGGGVVNGLNDDWSNKKCCSPCLRSLQRSLTPTGGGSGQEYAGPGQWQLERFFKSGSNQLLIINTVSRVIWCFVFFLSKRLHLCLGAIHTTGNSVFVPSKKSKWTSLPFGPASLVEHLDS